MNTQHMLIVWLMAMCLFSCAKQVTPPTQTKSQSSIKAVPILTCALAQKLVQSNRLSTFQAILAPHQSSEDYVVHCIAKTKYPGFLVKRAMLKPAVIEQVKALSKTAPQTHSVAVIIKGTLKPYSATYQTNPEIDPMGVVDDLSVVSMSIMKTPDWVPFRATERK